MTKITKAVIPAAGKGERMRPITNYISKPMLPLGKKPVLQHIIEELKEAGINEIAVVAKSNDRKMINYFEDDTSVQFIFDDLFSGPGGAILKAESFVGKEDFVVVFSDAPLMGSQKSRVVKNLISLKSEKEVLGSIAMYPIEKKEVSKRGVVTWHEDQQIKNDGSVVLKDIIEKPEGSVESPWASACRYVLDPEIFSILKKIGSDEDGEKQLTPAIRHWLQNGKKVLGYSLPKDIRRYDTGNFEGYFEAQRAFME